MNSNKKMMLSSALKALAKPISTGRPSDHVRVLTTGEAKALSDELTRLRGLVKQGEAVVNDFMPNVGLCVLQDYNRLDKFLVEAKKVQP